jgi:CheY-like chemotaxis protein
VLSYSTGGDPTDDSLDDTWDEDRRGRRILVVDDEPFILASLQRALNRYKVVVADGGRSAIERMTEEQDFDLVLCDLVMPPVHGSEVYKWIRENRPALTDRVIFMTAGAFTAEARSFLHSIRNPVLHKPFDTKTLRWAIGQALRRNESQ